MHWSMRISLTIALMWLAFLGGISYGRQTTKPEIQIQYVPEYIEKYIETTVTVTQYIDRPVPIHNEPGLFEFRDFEEFEYYLAWFRTEKMIQYGKDQCEDYAYQFMLQAIADGYLVSTELIDISKTEQHMANTVPIGNNVYLVDLAMGSIKLYGLKD